MTKKRSGIDKLLLGAVVGAAVGSVVGAGVSSRNKKKAKKSGILTPFKHTKKKDKPLDKKYKSSKNVIVRILRKIRLYLKRKNEKT